MTNIIKLSDRRNKKLQEEVNERRITQIREKYGLNKSEQDLSIRVERLKASISRMDSLMNELIRMGDEDERRDR
jgi:hypothetical protein